MKWPAALYAALFGVCAWVIILDIRRRGGWKTLRQFAGDYRQAVAGITPGDMARYDARREDRRHGIAPDAEPLAGDVLDVFAAIVAGWRVDGREPGRDRDRRRL